MHEQHVTLTDGARLWVARSGHGPTPLLLCHGGPGWWDTLQEPADLLTDHATSWRWDQRGCGRSSHHGPYTIRRYLTDLDELRHHTGHDTITVLGHSWGAQLALRYVLAYPNHAKALIYVSGNGIDPVDTWRPEHQQRRTKHLGTIPDQRTAYRRGELTGPQAREAAITEWSLDYLKCSPG
ncbi:alpha/beta fold hydrolase [Streptomyces sp. NPDC005525]|uniref:alpha/beta fold hydrolase n=1 Tax=Streptomyces sp. NPDC005525 TaxID=3364720 RepID=UPI0036CD01C4